MSKTEKSKSSSFVPDNSVDENACVVCFKNVELYSIGECDHPVCYECSTRMRVLCCQNECPICRQDLQKVIFTSEILSYRQLESTNRTGLYDKKYRICFLTLKIQAEFYKLLDNPCSKCDIQPFPNFEALKEHVRKEHDLLYCELCTENLKIFSFERRCYTREELSLHRRTGDIDNKSHKGHPLCKYCNCRYLDRDELFRHLRREHYYCHFCDADGANQFYGDYDSLREHFKIEHYLCEEGECAQEKFTAVFRSDIDLKAHKAHIHGKLLGKQGTKQARTLEFEFTLAPRNRMLNHQNGDISRPLNAHSVRIRNDPQMEFEIEDRNKCVQMPQKIIDHQNENEFPSLGSGGSTTVTLVKPSMSISAKAFRSSNIARTKENFPALGGEHSAHDPGPSLNGGSYGNNNSIVSAVLKNSSVPTNVPSKNTGMVIHVSNRPNSMSISSKRASDAVQLKSPASDFPALPSNKNNLKYADMVEPSNMVPQPMTMSAVAAKHKSMVMDNFVSSSSSNGTKINVVRNEEDGLVSPVQNMNFNPPKLNSKNNFPELSAPSSSNLATLQHQWVVPKQKVEPKKLKVAAAPVLSSKFSESNGSKSKTKKDNKKVSNSIESTQNKSNFNNISNKQLKTSVKENSNSSKNEKHKEIAHPDTENTTIEHKVSKLQIDNFKSEEKDFPSLKPKTTTIAPPGFEKKSRITAPPGFNVVKLSSVARPQNNFTFTTSLGESFNILPTYKYCPPPDSPKRNFLFCSRLEQTMTSEVSAEFRKVSQMFKGGMYKAEPYYEHCQAALGEKFDEIFPELLVLLPDINKQQELFLVHSQKLKENLKSRKNRIKSTKLEVCQTCKQVLFANDVASHTRSHLMENNFPILSENWRK